MTVLRTLTPRTARRVVVAGLAASAVAMTGIGYAAGEQDFAIVPTIAAPQPALVQQQHAESGHPGGRWSTDQSPFAGSGGPFQQTEPTEGSTNESTATDATADQELGLVYVNTTLDYGSGQAAGTGMVLTSDGEILTNHHVVQGATSISVQVISTGRTYDADVVGYDATHDVAVLQLDGASGLAPVTTDVEEAVQVGDTVTGVGNAFGDGGAASAAAGTVVALDQSITVSDETGGTSSRLSNLIQVDADIIAGDSGGALYDDDGEVVGMNTAASSGSSDVTGYAVPIAQALEIVEQVESGDQSADVEIGNHGYLGVSLSADVTGALVAGVVNDSPAESAGLTAGSTITSLDGAAVTSADALSAAVAALEVGDRVTLAWTDTSGQAHHESVTLGEGPVA
nr:septum formation initiator [Aeromicrobium sp.]